MQITFLPNAVTAVVALVVLVAWVGVAASVAVAEGAPCEAAVVARV